MNTIWQHLKNDGGFKTWIDMLDHELPEFWNEVTDSRPSHEKYENN